MKRIKDFLSWPRCHSCGSSHPEAGRAGIRVKWTLTTNMTLPSVSAVPAMVRRRQLRDLRQDGLGGGLRPAAAAGVALRNLL